MIEFEEIATGTGAFVKDGDRVTMHYRGTFPDGREFDSSFGRSPFSFTVGRGQVVKGFDLLALGMQVGGKRKGTLPPEFAYGTQGAGNVIPPNATLVFEVELLKIG